MIDILLPTAADIGRLIECRRVQDITMARRGKVEEEPPADTTAWLIESGLAEILLMNNFGIKFMCMLGYTFMHGTSRLGRPSFILGSDGSPQA